MFWELGRRLRLPEWAAQEMSHCGARKVRPRDGRGPTTPRAESGGSVCPEPGPGPHPWADVCVQGGGRKLRQQLEARGRPRPQRKCVGRGGQSGSGSDLGSDCQARVDSCWLHFGLKKNASPGSGEDRPGRGRHPSWAVPAASLPAPPPRGHCRPAAPPPTSLGACSAGPLQPRGGPGCRRGGRGRWAGVHRAASSLRVFLPPAPAPGPSRCLGDPPPGARPPLGQSPSASPASALERAPSSTFWESRAAPAPRPRRVQGAEGGLRPPSLVRSDAELGLLAVCPPCLGRGRGRLWTRSACLRPP